MKKLFWLIFLLTGCMTVPQKAFQADPDSDSDVFVVRAAEVQVVPMTTHFDMLPHVENKMPMSPEEAIQKWAEKHLRTTPSTEQKLWIVIENAEMLKTLIPAESFFKADEESYTLNYKMIVQIRRGETEIQSVPVDGKGFITVAKRASLATKEKGWAWLIQKMLTHLKTKMKTDLKNVFVE